MNRWEAIDSFYTDLAYKMNPKTVGIEIRFNPQTLRHGTYRARYSAGKVRLDLAVAPTEPNFYPTFERAVLSALQIYFGTTTAVAISGKIQDDN